MRIKCNLIREGGTLVEIGGTEYHFAPQADGSHVAEVTNKEHISRFLSISEGYELAGFDNTDDNKQSPALPTEQVEEPATVEEPDTVEEPATAAASITAEKKLSPQARAAATRKANALAAAAK